MPAASRGFGGRVLSVAEVTEGTTPTNPAFVKFSDHVQGVSVSLDPALDKWHDIGNFDVASFTKGLPVYGLKVSYLLHVNRQTQAQDAIDRLASNALKSQTIEVSVDRDGATPGYFTFRGCKSEQVSGKLEVGKPAKVDISYMALAVDRSASEPSVGTGSRESAALGALSVFSTSILTRGGSAVAFVTRGCEFTVSHNLVVHGTDNQVDPKAIFEGVRALSGNFDISVDDGGVALANAALAGTEASVVLKFGTTGALQLTFNAAVWEKLDFDLGVDEGVIFAGVPFTAKSVTVATVA